MSPPYSETALTFDCRGETLVGIVSTPLADADVAVLIIVGGPQYRAGSHRQFTLLARALAGRGVAALRFDVRGMGDSSGAARGFEALSEDIDAAVGALQRALPGVSRIVLWGLCDGASAALLYLHERQRDARIAALCLANPWVRSAQTLAQTHVRHYYGARLREAAFWKKLLTGGVGVGSLRGYAANLLQARRAAAGAGADGSDYRARMATALARFEGPCLLVLSGDDFVAREFDEHSAADPLWRRALAVPSCTRRDFAGADHTFSKPADNARLQQAVASWLQDAAAAPTRP